MSPQDPMAQAAAAYASGDLEAVFESLEGAYAQAELSGDRLAAAAAATRIAMHLLIDTGLVAPIRWWIKRAELLLESEGTSPVHAWLGVAKAYERFQSGEFAEARRLAEEAIDAGIAQGDRSATAMAEIARARSHIFEGDVDTGLRLLEDAAVAATSGDVDPLTEGLIYCEIVCAWQGMAMYDIAEQWTDAMERFSARHGIGSVRGRCRIHRAEILRLRGECRDAESEALAACEELQPYLRREFGWPLTELGAIRLRMADLEGAEEAFLAAHEKGWEPQPGLALLRLAQGDVAAASSLVRDALDQPLGLLSKELPPNNDLRRAPLLEAQVEIEVVAGDLDTARRAADELDRIAEIFKSRALRASAALSRGRVSLAEGATSEATRAFRMAVHLWSEIAAPYETALARMGLGEAYRAADFEGGAVLEFRAARAAFERIGAGHHADLAARALGAEPELRSEPDHLNRFRCDGDFWTISFDGNTSLVRDMKGLRYLKRLIDTSGREVHVVDLVSLDRGESVDVRSFGDAGPLLDDRAKALYRRRLREIEEDIEEAEEFGDAERAARSAAERDFLLREISRAVGMDGRDRRAGATSERARAAVTRAIRHAMKRITEQNPVLGEHLERTVKTGTYCAYMPDPQAAIEWETSPSQSNTA